VEIQTVKNKYRIIQLLSGRSNVFLLTNGKNYILTDTSVSRSRKKLAGKLDVLKIHHIDCLILTHNHFDHAANASWIKEKYNARVIIHHSEASELEKGINKELPDGTMALTRPIVALLKRIGHPVIHLKPCQPDILTNDRYDLKQFGFNAYILHTPGHSVGSQSVIIDDEIALVGDSMIGAIPGSIMPPFGLNIKQITETWEKLLETGCRLFLPSHGTGNKRELVARKLSETQCNN
jgi:glyoxylase-like metal-dependent hydrolase (beta-lactamase superfamily II)